LNSMDVSPSYERLRHERSRISSIDIQSKSMEIGCD